MSDNPRVQNFGVLFVLALIYIIPSIFLPNEVMLDAVSVPLLVFGMWSFFLLARETSETFWEGQRGRAALALYGLFAVFLSVIITRSYGLLTRNTNLTGTLDDTHIYSAALYIQFIGLWLFTRSAASPAISPAKNNFGQLVAGIILGAILASSRLLEPLLVMCGKMFNRLF